MTRVIDIKAISTNPTKAALLERMVSINTASYKLYFLMGLLDEVEEGNSQISLYQIALNQGYSVWDTGSVYRVVEY